MKFNVAYQRAVIGNDIEIQIDAENEEIISGVNCTLDGFGIASDDLSETPVVSFHRTLSRVGEARPGEVHRLLVEVRGNPAAAAVYASRIWTDLS